MLLSNKRKIILLTASEDAHYSTWDTTQAGSANDTIVLPTEAGGDYSGSIISWGDGKKDAGVHGISHTYDYSGIYQIKIEGKFEGFRFNNSGDKAKLLSIDNGGKYFRLGNSGDYFYGCTNLTKLNNLITTGMTDFSQFMRGCSSFNNDVKFDTSSAGNMGLCFFGCTLFNKPLNWNTDLVSDFYYFLASCPNFNQSLASFNTANVTRTNRMFANCTDFNQDISHFNMEGVTDITNMLSGATSWSTENYDKFLIEIATNQNVVNSLTFTCSSQYTAGGAAEAARTDLINTDLWSFSDGGPA